MHRFFLHLFLVPFFSLVFLIYFNTQLKKNRQFCPRSLNYYIAEKNFFFALLFCNFLSNPYKNGDSKTYGQFNKFKNNTRRDRKNKSH